MILGSKKLICKRGHARSENNLEGSSYCVECSRLNVRTIRLENPELRNTQVSYQSAKKRCTSPDTKSWKHYGGRGIEFRFKSLSQLIGCIGLRPSRDYSLDRIDGNGHYEPGNVRWATREEQAKNRCFLRSASEAELLAEVKRRGLLESTVSIMSSTDDKETSSN